MNNMRYDNILFYRKPAAEWTDNPSDQCNFITVTRPEKISEWVEFYEETIANCKAVLDDPKSDLTEDARAGYLEDLKRYEKELAALPISREKIKHTYKKISQDKIKDYVLNEIRQYREKGVDHIIAEDIAYQLNVKVHFVTQIFHKLNVEGVLSQPVGRPPHDTNRDAFTGGFGGWSPNWYKILPEK
jgi:hypothetical protein